MLALISAKVQPVHDSCGMVAGSAAAFTVYEQEPEEVTALAAQLLPAAALAPGVVLDRLLQDAVLHSGQVPLL